MNGDTYKWCPRCQSDTLHNVSGCSGCSVHVGDDGDFRDDEDIGDHVIRKLLPWMLGGLAVGFYFKSKSKRK